MNMSNQRDIIKLARNSFSKIWNRQFLVFLLFLLLSASFWLFQTLNITYEQEFTIPIKVNNIPTGVVITSDIPEHITVTIRDKGVTLLNYKYGEGIPSIQFNFENYTNPNGHVSILTSSLLKDLSRKLAPGSTIESHKPDTIEFYYNHGLHKRVPVSLLQLPRIESGYALTETQLKTDSVTVYASSQLLEKITSAEILPYYLETLSNTTTLKLPIKSVRGVKFIPDSIEASFHIDRMVEKKITVPIKTEGFPANKILLPIPQEVEITCQVAMNNYRSITSNMFEVTAHFEDLPTDGTTHCPLRLKTIPEGVSRVRITPKDVEYVIEEITLPQ